MDDFMDNLMDEIIDDMLVFIENWRRVVFDPDFDHINGQDAMQVLHVLDDATNVLEDKVQRLPHPALTLGDILKLDNEVYEIAEITHSFCGRILIPLSVADENDLNLGGEFDRLNIRDVGFLFSYRGCPWLPDVVNQLASPFCWAFSSTQLLIATYSFQHLKKGPRLSTQCIINGVAHHAPQDMENVNEDLMVYEASACVALRFVQSRGCDLEANVPFVGYQLDDMPFLRIAEIQGDPFSIDVDSTIYAIRAVMEDYGCLVGVFELDHTFDSYPGPPEVYYIEVAEEGVDRPLHYALISGVGCLDGGRPFLQIQNSFGTDWGEGYGYIGKDLFHHIHGLRGVQLWGE